MDAAAQSFLSFFFRTAGFLAALPVGEKNSGFLPKIFISFLLALALTDYSAASNGLDAWQLPGDFLLGILFGLPLALLVSSAEMFGELVDSGRGQTIGAMYDPINGNSHAVFAILARHYVWIALLIAGTFDQLLTLLALTQSVVPPGGWSFATLSSSAEALSVLIYHYMNSLISFYLIFASVFFVVDAVLAVASKAVPRLSLFGESFQVKTLCALVLLYSLTKYDLVSGLVIFPTLVGISASGLGKM